MLSETTKLETHLYFKKLTHLVFIATLWHEIIEPILWMRTQRPQEITYFPQGLIPINDRAKISGEAVWLKNLSS